MNIVRRIAIALCLVLVPSLIAGAVLVQRQARHDDRAGVERALVTEARDQSAKLEAYFDEGRRLNLLLAGDSVFRAAYADGSIGSHLAAPALSRRLESIAQLYPGSISEACFIDRSGQEIARIVRKTWAGRDDLSPDESKAVFFAPTLALPAGRVFQSPPYVSGDTGQWVISNSTPLAAAGRSPAFVHFEVSVESFRQKAAAMAGVRFRVTLVDVRSRRPIFDTQRPLKQGAPLGAGAERRLGLLASGVNGELVTQYGARPTVIKQLKTGRDNANHWAIVVTPLSGASGGKLSGGAVGLGLAALVLLTGLGVMLAFVRRMRSDVRHYSGLATRVAEGDLQAQVAAKGDDELADLADRLNEMIASLTQLSEAATKAAAGDLTTDVRARSESDALGRAFAGMLESLNGLLGEIGAAARVVRSTSSELASASTEAEHATEAIARAAGEVASGAAAQLADVDSAREIVGQLAAASLQSAAVRELGAKSERIGDIVETITSIADQTNLLALNAAIEAARAGEQGRGFAIVAEQVRRLAEDSGGAAGLIAELVAAIQAESRHTIEVVEHGAGQTEAGVETVMRAGQAFAEIETAIADVHERVSELADGARRMQLDAEQLRGRVDTVAEVAEESSQISRRVSDQAESTTASTQNIAASANELARTSEALNELLDRFRIRS